MADADRPPVDEGFVHGRLDAIARAAASPLVVATVRAEVHDAVADARAALGEDRAALHRALDRCERAVGGRTVPRRTRERVGDGVRQIRAELDPTTVVCECGRERPAEQPRACR
jgi:hypothetical protein